MADAATKTFPKRMPAGHELGSFQIADAQTVFVGSLAGLQSGYLDDWTDGANDVFLGLITGGDDRLHDGALTGETSDVNPPQATVEFGVTLERRALTGGDPTAADVGALVYCGSSNLDDMTLSITSRTRAIGRLVRFRSASSVDVRLFTPSEMGNTIGVVVLTDNTGGTGTDTLATLDTVITPVGGSGMTSAQEADYDAAMGVLANSISSLADKVNEILANK